MQSSLTVLKGFVCVCVCACLSMQTSYLIAVHHEVMCGDKSLEDNHPARVGRALKQRVGQLGNAHVHLIGTVDKICQPHMEKKTDKEKNKQKSVTKVWQPTVSS